MSSVSLQVLNVTKAAPVITVEQAVEQIDFNEIVTNAPVAELNLKTRLIAKIDDFNLKIEEKIPTFAFQKKLDTLGRYIEQTFAPLQPFNDWLQTNGQGNWFSQLLQFIGKLPLKAARNVVQQLYSIIRGVICGLVHPIQAVTMAAKLLISLPDELIKPETWSKIGAGTVGTSLGQACIASSFLSLVGIGVGAAMIVGGVSIGTLMACINAGEGDRFEASMNFLKKQATELSETFVTSFYIGLIIGGIRKALQTRKQTQIEKQQVPKSADFYDVVNLCHKNPDNWPPVAYAVKLGRHDVVKFLLDHKEAADALTGAIDIYSQPHWDTLRTRIVGQQPGLSALELAIQQNDAEMVKILLTHNPNNFANAGLVMQRFQKEFLELAPNGGQWRVAEGHPYTGWTIDSWGRFIDGHHTFKADGPIAEAIRVGNREIVEMLVKSLNTEEHIFNTYEPIRASQQEGLMRLWLEQKSLVLSGKYQTVADSSVQLFLKGSLQSAVTARDVTLVTELLKVQLGSYELEQACKLAYETQAYDILELIETRLTSPIEF